MKGDITEFVFAASFKLRGTVVDASGGAVAFSGGSVADLGNEAVVLVKGTVDGLTKTLTASWIEFIQPDNAGVRLAGAMGDFASVADFKIGSQRVDTSSASFGDGAAADPANGRVLEVRGSLVEVAGVKVVKASLVRFLNQ